MIRAINRLNFQILVGKGWDEAGPWGGKLVASTTPLRRVANWLGKKEQAGLGRIDDESDAYEGQAPDCRLLGHSSHRGKDVGLMKLLPAPHPMVLFVGGRSARTRDAWRDAICKEACPFKTDGRTRLAARDRLPWGAGCRPSHEMPWHFQEGRRAMTRQYGQLTAPSCFFASRAKITPTMPFG